MSLDDPRAGPGAVLLVGPPGTGKSLLGQALAGSLGPLHVHWLNVGEELRSRGLVDTAVQHPTEANVAALAAAAAEVLAAACRECKSSGRVLLVEAVKDEEDALRFLDVLREHDMPLLQVLWLDPSVTALLRDHSGTSRAASLRRDAKRGVKERRSKWAANAPALLKIFSSLGVLAEVVGAPWSLPARPSRGARGRGSTGRGRGRPQYGTQPPQRQQQHVPPDGSLAAVGYAPGFATARAAATGSAPAGSPNPTPLWVHRAGWCAADGRLSAVSGLSLHWVEPVVSPRLVTSTAERQAVLDFAAASAGVHSMQSGAPGFAVPVQSVNCMADARWVSWPGRYLVSRKCDGTRFLLIVAEDGMPYLLDRAGSLYSHPLRAEPATSADTSGAGGTADSGGRGRSGSSGSEQAGSSGSNSQQAGSDGTSSLPPLPPGACLDGELVWVGPPGAPPAQRRGFFLAFDVLAVGGEPKWQLPLRARQAALQGLGLAEAEESSALRAAAQPAVADAETVLSVGSASGSGSATATGISANAAALAKKQQAPPPGRDSVTVMWKRHREVSAETLQELEASHAACPYPTDGLVFTPADLPYPFSGVLLLKWQPPQQAAADILGSRLQEAAAGGQRSPTYEPSWARDRAAAAKLQRLSPWLVYECVPAQPPAAPERAGDAETAAAEAAAAGGLSPGELRQQQRAARVMQQRARSAWLPVSVRFDKRGGNAPAAVARLERSAALGHYLPQNLLVAAVREVQEAPAVISAAAAAGAPAGSAQQTSAPVHPARRQPFVQLCGSVMAEVAAGRVERSPDSESGLEVFCYRMALGAPSSATAAMCRGLVLHPPSRTVVATPFVRFGEPAAAVSASVVTGGGASVVLSALSRFLSGSALARAAAVCRSWRRAIVEDSGCQEALTDARRQQEADRRASGVTAKRPGVRVQQAQRSARPSASRTGQLSLMEFLRAEPRSPDSDSDGGGSNSDGDSSDSRQEAEAAAQAEAEAALLPGGPADAANRALYCGGCRGGDARPAAASFKLDGSLIIAFLWQGRLRTTTRRRMDSEQAVWARDWLVQRGVDARMAPGWTYLFEAIYRDNTHAIQYPFEGCVLLSAVGLDGRELPRSGRAALAARLGTLAAPYLEGLWGELLARLSAGTQASACKPGDSGSCLSGSFRSSRRSGTSAAAAAVPAFEGWVLEADGGWRVKLVQAAFKRAGAAAAGLLHPLALWDAVRCGGASRASLAAGLPAHMQRELRAQLDALERLYCFVQRALAAAVGQPVASAGAGSSAARQAAGPEQLEECLRGLARLSLADCGTGTGPDCSQPLALADLRCRPQFHAALRYALQAGSADAGPMHLRPDYRANPGPAPLLRGMVLACFPPAADGALPGYTPSPAFAQTAAKSWARNGPLGSRGAYLAALTAGEAAPDPSGIGQVAFLVLPRADGETLVQAQLVCREWRGIVAGDAACQAALRQLEAKAQAAAADAAAARWREARYYGLSFRPSGFYSSEDDEWHLGYGSP